MASKCSPILLILAILSVLPTPAGAQPYCANFHDGMQQCGIPSLEMCQQTISGLGGYCGPDQTAQLPPNMIQRLEQANPESPQAQPNAPSAQPGGLNWMPPPPGQ